MTFQEFCRKAAHKLYYGTIGRIYVLDRFVRFRNPKSYWTQRGGESYFQEQEAVEDRTLRSRFISDEVHHLDFGSILEVGCGYGKQLKNFCGKGRRVTGCDYSRPQLLKAKDYLKSEVVSLVEADAEHLPFADKSFDVVMSSAVILHNPYEKAKRITAEMIRVSRRFLVHNEDTDVNFSRYGYDFTKTYQAMGFQVIKSTEIPYSQDPSITQFTIAELPGASYRSTPENVALQYH